MVDDGQIVGRGTHRELLTSCPLYREIAKLRLERRLSDMKKRTVWRRLLSYLKAHRVRLFFVLFFSVISTAFMVLAPFLIGKVTTTLINSIADGVFYWETILRLLGALAALYLISQLFSFLQGFGMAKITAEVMRKLRSDIAQKMHQLKLDYYDTHTHGRYPERYHQ